ncbi:FAD-dependent oxidoreductase [Aspergillus saccharolyticus JOP 1030-1]|uniref:FAD/NAD(P)-binding domain-containing protein n=1 Tax=Aspergillus saccharolyticus JOP 1030-1 TaxID=1450539 RepID=A0A318YZP6_9EURO|nr:FAD/NAD(P)-binding domain-containing protein [Aspergillus saccharolyticus JOP 1030-1]PYH40455.1 FAD/NAD(P)-binding domain-containing protein [Aspergillus saccharolyticus JOP 1030-1]
MPQHLAIIGAGPSGLTLAAILQKYSVPFTIFERETSSSSRFQGGSLDLHPDSGQLALREAGLWEDFQQYARYHDQDYRFGDKTAATWLFHQAPANADGRPEIDRSMLRKILIDSLDPRNIRWGYSVSEITPQSNGQIQLTFQDGQDSVLTDLVVGADGTRSKVRPLLTSMQPAYTGLTVIDCRISNLDEQFPHLADFVGRGTFFCLSEGSGIFMQRNGDGSLRVYPCLRVEEKWAWSDPSFDWWDCAKMTGFLIDTFFSTWDPRLKEVIRSVDPVLTPRAQYRMPPGLRYPHRKGFTLIEDALHVMSWFAGEGANLAMLDALDIARAIVANPGDLDQAVRDYEVKVVASCRADVTNEMSQDLLVKAMADDSPRAYVEAMAKAMDVWFAAGKLLARGETKAL